jgi:DNA-binding beta-propeller fold protein YncE
MFVRMTAFLATLALAMPMSALAASWIVPGSSDVDIVIDDVVTGAVTGMPPAAQHPPWDAAVNKRDGVAYVLLQGHWGPGTVPVVVVNMLTQKVSASFTDPDHLLVDSFGDVAQTALGIAISPDLTRVYFTVDGNEEKKGLAVADALTNRVIARIPVDGEIFRSVALSPDGTRAYVFAASIPPNEATFRPTIFEIDTANLIVTRHVVLSAIEHGYTYAFRRLLVTADGNTIYYLQGGVYGDGPFAVYAIDTATLGVTTVSDPGGKLQQPISMTMAGNRLYVVDQGDPFVGGCPAIAEPAARVVVIDRTTLEVTGTIPFPSFSGRPAGAIGTSLDETQIYIGWLNCDTSMPPQGFLGILDPSAGGSAGGAFVGTVSDPNSILVAGQAAVDPVLSARGELSKCCFAKRKAAGMKLGSKLFCHAKEAVAASFDVMSCLTSTEPKFDAAFSKAGPVCPGDAPDIEERVDSCVNTLLADVPGSGFCQAASLKALGKAAKGLLTCAAKNVIKPGSVGICAAKRDAKLQAALSSAGSCAGSAYSDLHVGCLDDLVGALPPASAP